MSFTRRGLLGGAAALLAAPGAQAIPRDRLETLRAKVDEAVRRQVKQECEASLAAFIRHAWHVLEPGAPYVHGWHIDALCAHLEAISKGTLTPDGDSPRLLCNVPPGPMRDDSVVETSRGPVLLREIRVGDRVLTHKGRYRKVEAVHHQGVLPILRITTNSGRVTHAAPSHPYLTPKGWVDARDLVAGDRLAVVNPTEDREKAVGITPEIARLLGYMVGDGSLTQGVMTFTNQDVDTLADFERCVQSLGFETSTRLRGNHSVVSILGGRKVKDFFAIYGLAGKNSYQKRIPPQVLAADRNIVSNFIGAYWSCDGMIAVRATRERGPVYRSSCTTVSKGLADDLLYALGMIGIEGRIRRKERALETAAQPGGRYVSFNIEVQKETACALFGNMPGLCARKNAYAVQCRTTFDQVLWHDEIVSIEPVEPASCMCLTVAEDHSFVCSGIAVKNTMKSLLVTVFWPAFEWGPLNMPHLRYLGISHNVDLAGKFNTAMRRLVTSEWYQAHWGDRVQLTQDQNAKVNFENTRGGFRMASPSSSVTGRRADRVLVDDPHSVDDANSDALRSKVVENFLEAVPSRLTSPTKSAIIVIMQRLHEEDVSGVIHDKDLGYTSVILPMEFDPGRRCQTDVLWQPPWADEPEPFCDPREVEGELLFPERFPREVVERDKIPMGSYAVAGQFQQLPIPRGGGIIKYEYWRDWDGEAAARNNVEPGMYPRFDFVLASVDTAYTAKTENDPSAFTVWGVWTDDRTIVSVGANGQRIASIQRLKRVMLIYGWAKHLPLHGPLTSKMPGESDGAYRDRASKDWGLIEWIADGCRRYRVDKLLVEAKASGISVAQEIRRLYSRDDWSVQLINPGSQDKVTRAHQVQPMFEGGLVYAPVPIDGRQSYAWVEKIKSECATFPKGKHDDLVDSTTQALSWLRTTGMLQMDTEAQYDYDQSITHRGRPLDPIYPA